MEELLEILREINSDVDYMAEKHLVDDEIFVSFDIIQCIAECEEKFGIEIPEEEIIAQNFQSAEAIWGMIERLK